MEVRALPLSALQRALRRSRRGAVVVVPCAALSGSILAGIRAAGSERTVMVLVVLGCRGDAIAMRRLGMRGFIPVAAEDLRSHLAAAVAIPVRPDVRTDEWFPRAALGRLAHGPLQGHGGLFEKIEEEVPLLHEMTVARLAERVGCGVRFLERLFVASGLVLLAEDLIWQYRRALAAACCRRGDTPQATALLCGYASLQAFRRAFKRRRVHIPRFSPPARGARAPVANGAVVSRSVTSPRRARSA